MPGVGRVWEDSGELWAGGTRRQAAWGTGLRGSARGALESMQFLQEHGAQTGNGGVAGPPAFGRASRPSPGCLPPRSASTPETWTKFTQDNLCRAQRERLDSANLWVLVDCSLRKTSEDLGLQCEAVNLAFGRRCEELEDARHKLQHHLHKMGHPQPRRWLPLLQTTVPPLIT